MTHEKSAVSRPLRTSNPLTRLPVNERGAWIATSRGGMWSVLHPHSRDVFIDDIAWGLSRQCRYSGQLKPEHEFYSVAEHSMLMTRWAIDNIPLVHLEDALAVLLHDASEAIFCGDVVTPIKDLIPEYRNLENKTQQIITGAFGLTPDNTLITKAQVKDIDKRIRLDERKILINEPALSTGLIITWDDEPDLKSLDIAIECLLPGQARAEFLRCFVWCCDNLPLRKPDIQPFVTHQLNEMIDSFSEHESGLDAEKSTIRKNPEKFNHLSHHLDNNIGLS